MNTVIVPYVDVKEVEKALDGLSPAQIRKVWLWLGVVILAELLVIFCVILPLSVRR